MADERLIAQIGAVVPGRLCAYRNGLPSRTRRFVVTTGLGPNHNLGVYNDNVDTVLRALTERYFFCKVAADFQPALRVKPQAFAGVRFKQFRDAVLSEMPNLPRLTRYQVVERYTGPKRAIYQKAHESLLASPLTRKDALLSSFTKFEKVDVSKAPRLINPRSPRYNLELGRYLKHAEKPFFKAINKAFGARTAATVIKGMNADQAAAVIRDKWERFQKPVAVGLDASKFDAHVSVPALRYEHSFYSGLFAGFKTLQEMLNWQLRNTGCAHLPDGKVKFSIVGTRSSGDLNTSLGNCILMCAMVHSYASLRGVDLELCNNGDDCVVIMESDDLATFQLGLSDWFMRVGFRMVVETPVYEFEEIEFCQTRPVKLASGWRLCRNHGTIFIKDPICLVDTPNTKCYRKWLGAVGECGSILASGCPVQQAFYNALLRNGTMASDGFKNHIFKNESMLGKIKDLTHASSITAEARVSYYYAFGVLPDLQREIEKFFNCAVIEDYDYNYLIDRDMLHTKPGINLQH